MKDLPARIFLPVRLFHAWVTGILLGTLLALGIFQLQQKLFAATSIANFRGNGWSTYVPPSEVGTASAPQTPTADDLDGDGIPNDWEAANCHNPEFAGDSAYDFDFDGLTAKQEYDLSVRTGGEHGNPLGKFKLASITPPTGYSQINSTELIESAKNGLSVIRVMGQRTGESVTSEHLYTYNPATEIWLHITPPEEFSGAAISATDVNSKGQVVGSLEWPDSSDSYEYKGFIWSPSESSPAGGSSEEFFIESGSSSPAPAIPVRISDTGYLLYMTTSSSTVRAADHHRQAIHPVDNSLEYVSYSDVNDYGEFVGDAFISFTGQHITFLAAENGPCFITEFSPSERAGLPEVDFDEIEWMPSAEPQYDEWGNLMPGFYYQFGTIDRLGLRFARNPGSSDIWWSRDSDPNSMLSVFSVAYSWGGINDWGEVGSSRVDLQACKLEYSIVSPK